MYCVPEICSVADGLIVASASKNVPSTVDVFVTYGLKSTTSLNEYSAPDKLETNTGISWVVIFVVLTVLASSIIGAYDWKDA